MSKKNWIMIKRGLSQDAKHREAIGQAIWCYMHIIDRADWETGIVYDWKDKDEADDMGVNVRRLREWRRNLDEAGYITCKQEQYGQKIIIHNWTNPRAYSGEVLNKQGYKKTAPQKEAQGSPQGSPQGSIKVVTPTYSSINQESLSERKQKAEERKATQRANKKDPFDFLIENGKEIKTINDMRVRVEAATGLGLSREWDKTRSPWNGYEKTLIKREAETGQTIEQFMEWYNSDDFRKKSDIWLNPDKIELMWGKAFTDQKNWTPIPDVETTHSIIEEKEKVFVKKPANIKRPTIHQPQPKGA